jgi:CHC2 zinc finger
MSGNNDLRQKIDEAKGRLPMPQLLEKLGLGDRAKKSALCPWHDDQHPSFSVFQNNGAWFHRCFVGCSSGDEIAFLVKHCGISRREAISRYLDLAGLPPCTSRRSHKYPEPHQSPECPKYPKSPVHPVSNRQGPENNLLAEKDLKGLAAYNACTAHNTARKRRWQLVRDLRAIELRHGALDTTELILTFDKWYRISKPFLDSQKAREDYLAAFLAEFGKVRVPTGEGQTITEALACVSGLSSSKLPVIPDMPDVPDSWRRIAALHRDLSRRSANGIYFLTCRDAAKACPGLSHQTAYNISLALAQLGVVQIVHKGDPRPNGGKAAQFQYLLPQTENAAHDSEEQDVEI